MPRVITLCQRIIEFQLADITPPVSIRFARLATRSFAFADIDLLPMPPLILRDAAIFADIELAA
jgi:hypothetical protein